MAPKISRKRKVEYPDADERPAKRSGHGRNSGALTSTPDATILDSKPARKSTKELEDIVNNINDTVGDLSDASSSDESFEDVPIAAVHQDEDDEMEWEDALAAESTAGPSQSNALPENISDLTLTLSKPDTPPDYSLLKSGKKGPSKIERAIRVDTHGMHVLSLMWHNTIRNSWCNDQEVQILLLGGMGEGLKLEIERWRVASGLKTGEDSPKSSAKTMKGKGKQKKNRDWSSEAEKQEPGKPDLSRGDPLIPLLKHIASYWKKRFQIVAPGLRKRGYKNVMELDKEMRAFAEDPNNASRFGERIASLEEFRNAAKKCAGSRDLGAQLFTALLRAIGIEARLVVSVQPTGFGWSKIEETKTKKDSTDSENMSSMKESPQKIRTAATKTVIEVHSSSSELSNLSSDLSDSDISIPDTSLSSNATKKQFDKDLLFPVYWTEILSPVTSTYYAVSTQLSPPIATNPEGFEKYEPRGAAAERSKQVICYVVAYSSDGTAKDVTVRYLKRRQLPGKTKGFRLPPEKIPVYNKRGTKIVKYVESDWIKRVMRFYARPGVKRTQADEIEDEGDLVPFKPTEKFKQAGSMPETLQAYKASTEFILERHLRREEAVVPTANPVKQFIYGKGEKEKTEPVYQRKDVVSCKTTESWHKEGRETKAGEQPLKLVPIRAVTLLRKQEVEHATRETGEKPLQGLYSRDQTQWIIPPPIKNGQIPKNAYGNIDIYVPSMVPKGAIHIRLGGTVKVCKKLGIDYAEAVTGFEFGHQMAVPVITGVVVAEEHEEAVLEAWEEEEEKKQRREDEKREKKLLGLWRKFAVGLKIMERVHEEYGVDKDLPDEVNPFIRVHKKDQLLPHRDSRKQKNETYDGEHEQHDFEVHAEEYGGGFLPEGVDILEPQSEHLEIQLGSQPTTKTEGFGHESDNEATSARKIKAAPRSLRTVHLKPMVEDEANEELDYPLDQVDEVMQTNKNHQNESEGNEKNEDDADDDSDLSDEEYAGFTKSPAKKPISSIASKPRATRNAATQSPYFKKKR
jgi:xeroderma pigmentosum group C-complementing protein